jgi:hypothetical protein
MDIGKEVREVEFEPTAPGRPVQEPVVPVLPPTREPAPSESEPEHAPV